MINFFAQIHGLTGIQTQDCLKLEEFGAPNQHYTASAFTLDPEREYHSSSRCREGVTGEDELSLYLVILEVPVGCPAAVVQGLRKQPRMM